MNIKVKYFGKIAEVTQLKEETVEFSGDLISELLEVLFDKYNKLRGNSFQVAQGEELVQIETQVSGKSIALLPSFAGG